LNSFFFLPGQLRFFFRLWGARSVFEPLRLSFPPSSHLFTFTALQFFFSRFRFVSSRFFWTGAIFPRSWYRSSTDSPLAEVLRIRFSQLAGHPFFERSKLELGWSPFLPSPSSGFFLFFFTAPPWFVFDPVRGHPLRFWLAVVFGASTPATCLVSWGVQGFSYFFSRKAGQGLVHLPSSASCTSPSFLPRPEGILVLSPFLPPMRSSLSRFFKEFSLLLRTFAGGRRRQHGSPPFS